MIALIVLMPISSMSVFAETGLTVDFSVPEITNQPEQDITITTSAGASVYLFINGEQETFGLANINGTITFLNVRLTANENFVKVRVQKDSEAKELEKKVILDTESPEFSITDIPAVWNSTRLMINGSVDEPSTLSFSVLTKEDLTPPAKVAGLSVIGVSDKSVKLSWEANTERDLSEYAIYRDDVRVGKTNGIEYTDINGLNSSTIYSYAVSGVDKSCNEGEKSVSVQATTLAGSFVPINTTIAQLSCSAFNFKKNVSVNGMFTEEITLGDGTNFISIIVSDSLGNSNTIEKKTVVDTKPPKILTTNLNSLSPTYTPEVKITGTVEKREGELVRVYVYINDETEPSYNTLVNSDESFSVGITLRQEAISTYSSSNGGATASAETSWTNNVKIVAVDEVGLKDEKSAAITYEFCGEGMWWDVELGDVTPAMLNPRLMIEGAEVIGFGFKLNWLGDGNVSVSKPSIKTKTISSEMDKDYDQKMASGMNIQWNSRTKSGYATVKIRNLGSIVSKGDNVTMLEKENNLSDHRIGDCTLPGFGCVKLLVEMNIDFNSKQLEELYGGKTDIGIQVPRNQRNCITIEIPIDRRLPSDKIPKAFLENSIKFFDTVIDGIDTVLKPLNTVKKVAFFRCMGSWIADYVMIFQEKFTCNVNAITGGGFTLAIAQTGQCKTEYSSDSTKQDACQTCSDAIQNRYDFEKNMKLVCDRVFCPAAPTFQKYVKDHSNVTVEGAKVVKKAGNLFKSFYNAQGKASDCSKMDPNQLMYGGPNSNTGLFSITKAYNEGTDKEYCSKLHPYDPKCCAYEYMSEWDSACVVMNELAQSKCIAAQNENVNTQTENNADSDCTTRNKIWNAAIGFCDAQANITTDVINSGYVYSEKSTIYEQKGLKDEKDRKIYYRVLTPSEANENRYVIERGYLTTEISNIEDVENLEKGKASKVNVNSVFEPDTSAGAEGEVTTYFFDEDPKTGEMKQKKISTIIALTTDQAAFGVDFTKASGITDTTVIKKVYEKVQSSIGIVDKEYVADPTSSFARSMQCVCLPGITSYLTLYRNVAVAAKGCLQSILYTGDGSAGMCRSLLSQYICDLIWDLINCFTKKYGTGFAFSSRESAGGIGNVLGAITKSGSEVQNTISGRYGRTSMFQTMFNERKLINSMCLWAFTGTWTFDFNAMLEQDTATAIQSIGKVFPCTRRFVSYNPSSMPVPGLTTWTYSFSGILFAGSDLTYSVEFVCSNGPDSDCAQTGEQSTRVSVKNVEGTGSMYLSKGQTAQFEEFKTLPNIRYDQVILRWQSTKASGANYSGESVCNIREVGKAPDVCQLDPAVGRFRCGFDLNSESWINFIKLPYPKYPTVNNKVSNKFVFERTGDKINFEAEIQQAKPKNEEGMSDDQYKKTVYMKISTPDGREIFPEQPVAKFTTEGTSTQTIPGDEYSIPWEKNWFTGATTTRTCTALTAGSSNIIKDSDKTKFFGEKEIRPLITIQGLIVTFTTDTLIYNEGNNFYYQTGVYNTDQRTFTVQGNRQPCLVYEPTNKIVNCGGQTIRLSVFDKEYNNYIIYSCPQTTSAAGLACDSAVKQWIAYFTVKEYMDDGSGNYVESEQSSMDSNGKAWDNIPVVFNVACMETAATPTGETTPDPTKITFSTYDLVVDSVHYIFAKYNNNYVYMKNDTKVYYMIKTDNSVYEWKDNRWVTITDNTISDNIIKVNSYRIANNI